MFHQLDNDTLVNVMQFLNLLDLIENLALVNSRLFRMMNLENDHQGTITNLLMERILFSSEMDLIGMLNRLERVLCVRSLLSDLEREVIDCDFLKEMFEREKFDEINVREYAKRMDWKNVIRIDTYDRLKTCMNIGLRLVYLDSNGRKMEKPFELLYTHDMPDKYTGDTVFFKDFLKLAQEHEFSNDKIYKFRLNYYSKKLKFSKVFSRRREEKLSEKEIFVKDYKSIYNNMVYNGGKVLSSEGLDPSMLSYQEGIENNVILSLADIQSSRTYRESYSTLRNGQTFIALLHYSNQLFDNITEPGKCGDLRVSFRNRTTQWSLSRKEMRKIIQPFVVYPLIYFSLATYSIFKFVNYDFGPGDTQIDPYLHFFDDFVFTFLSLVGVDHLFIRIRKVPKGDAKFMLLGTLGIFALKAILCFYTNSQPLASFFKTFYFSVPFMLSTVPLLYGLYIYPKVLFWYFRSSNWFYNNVAKKTGGFLRGCVNWITKFYSLHNVENDSPTRCVIN